MFATAAYAQDAAAPAAGGALVQFVPFLLIFVIMYFLMIRPQQKRLREHRDMVAALKKGDMVVTQGGVIGKVVGLREGELDLEIAQGVRIRVVRSTVATVMSPNATLADQRPVA